MSNDNQQENESGAVGWGMAIVGAIGLLGSALGWRRGVATIDPDTAFWNGVFFAAGFMIPATVLGSIVSFLFKKR